MGRYPQLMVRFYGIKESGQTSTVTKQQQQQQSTNLGLSGCLDFGIPFPSRGMCLTHPEPHSVTPSPERRVGAGRDHGADGGMKEEKSKPKIIN